MEPEPGFVDTALELARAGGAEDAEAFFERELGLTVKVFDEHVEEFSSAERRGLGVRVFAGKRSGRAYTSDLSGQGVRDAVGSALAVARVSPEDVHRGLPEAELFPGGATVGGYLGDELEIWGEDLAETTVERKIEFALSLERLARGHDARVKGVESAVYSESASHVTLANTRGFRSGYRSSVCYGYLMAIAEEKSDSQTGFGFTAGSSFADLKAEDAAREAAGKAVDMLGARQVETAAVPVLFDNISAAELLALLGVALNAESVVKGRSFLAGKLGESVASGSVSLLDDGLMKRGFGTAPFDAEGVAASCKAPVEGGVLTTYLHNCYTASRMGARSTGNASRSSYRSQVGVGYTNLILGAGGSTVEELMSGMGEGFLVLELQGAHAGLNPVTGEVSVGAKGLWVKGGKRAFPVREVTIAGSMPDIMKGIEGTGDDFRLTPLMGSVGTPSVLVGRLVVSGK